MKRIVLFIISLTLILSSSTLALANQEHGEGGGRTEVDTDGWVHSEYSNILNIVYDDHYHLVVDEDKIEQLELEGKNISVDIDKENYEPGGSKDRQLSTRLPTEDPSVIGEVYGYEEIRPDFTKDYEWTDTFNFMDVLVVDITYTKEFLFQPYHKKFSYPLTKDLLNYASYFPYIALVGGTEFDDYKIKITDNITEEVLLDGHLTDIARLNAEEIREQYIDYYNGVLPDPEIFLIPTYGNVFLKKEPNFVFTKWHKYDDDTNCQMALDFSWTADNETVLKDNFFFDIRYQEAGYELYPLYPENPYNTIGEELSVLGENVIYHEFDSSYARYQIEFEHAGTDDSFFYAQLVTKEGNILDIIAHCPVNGFFGIQVSTPVIGVDEIFKPSLKSIGGISFDGKSTY